MLPSAKATAEEPHNTSLPVLSSRRLPRSRRCPRWVQGAAAVAEVCTRSSNGALPPPLIYVCSTTTSEFPMQFASTPAFS